jgi:hypothetical protein
MATSSFSAPRYLVKMKRWRVVTLKTLYGIRICFQCATVVITAYAFGGAVSNILVRQETHAQIRLSIETRPRMIRDGKFTSPYLYLLVCKQL